MGVKAKDRFIIYGLGIDQCVHVSRNREKPKYLVAIEYEKHCAATEMGMAT